MQGLVPLGLISKFEVVAVCYHRIEPGIIVRDREEEGRAVNKHSRSFTVPGWRGPLLRRCEFVMLAAKIINEAV